MFNQMEVLDIKEYGKDHLMIIESRTFSTNEKKVYPDGSAYEGGLITK